MRRLRLNNGFPGWLAVLRLGLFGWLGLTASIGFAQTNFNSAQVISGQWGSVTNDNTGVIPDPGSPSHGGFVPNHPLWYKWTAPESGEVTLDTLGSMDTNYTTLDTVVAVYTGSTLSQLLQVAANDDYYPFNHFVASPQTFGSPMRGNPRLQGYSLPLTGPSILRFNAVAGETYYIAVDCKVVGNWWGISVGQGSVSLNWAFRSSGVFRFAGEDYDVQGYTTWSKSTNASDRLGMPQVLYQCAESESSGLGFNGSETVHNTYYEYNAAGVLVTVTRVAGSSGRMLVDYTTKVLTTLPADTNIPPRTYQPLNAQEFVDFVPVAGTLVFDDFEMSKTILIPLLGSDRYPTDTNNPYAKTNNAWDPGYFDKDFAVVLSNPRLDPYETTNVSPPRLDEPFSVARVRIMSMAALGEDPLENWTGDDGNTAPSHDVYNFPKKNFRVPRDVTNFWTTVNIGVVRTHPREDKPTSRSETINYRVNGSIADSVSAREHNNFFPLNPGSDYAMPDTNNACPFIFPFAPYLDQYPYSDFAFTSPDSVDGTVTIGSTDQGTISFRVANEKLTRFNNEFNVVIFRPYEGGNVSVGENNECHVTILFDDEAPPAGSVDEFYNTDFGSHMKPPVITVPSSQPHPGTDGTVWSLAVQPDNKAIIAGQFTSYNGTARSCIARATDTGPIDLTFNPGSGANAGMISCVALLPDESGKMMIGGTFQQYNGFNRKYIARLDTAGKRDPSFNPSQDPDGPIWALAIQTNNQVVVVGDFTMIGNTPRAHVARYNADGSLDLTFDPSTNAPDDTVWAVALQPDGKIVIGGQFTHVGNQPIGGLTRLNADGSADTTFNTNLGSGVDGIVYTVAVQNGTKLVIGGEFQNVGIAPRTRIARLNDDGTIDNSFNSGTGADDTVFNINALADGSMYAGGLFTVMNGTHRLGFTRLYADGTVDTTFLDTAYNQFAGLHRKYHDRQWTGPGADPNPEPRPFVNTSQVLPNGNVVIGGSFTQVGGGQADASIRFDSDYPTSTPDSNVYTEPKARDGVRNRNNFARLIGGATPGPGNIGLQYSAYTVNKSQLALNVDLVRENGTLGYSSANFALQPGLAQSGQDYVYNSVPPIYLGSWDPQSQDQTYYSTFAHAITRAHSDGFAGANTVPTDAYGHVWFPYAPGTLAVTIKNSGGAGNVGTQVQLANPSGVDQFFLGGQNIPLGNALGVSTAPLTIVDDNQNPGTINFASANFYVNENGTNATIIITRTNGAAGFPSVLLSTTDGTGRAGSNYVAYSKRLSFAPGVTAITNREIKVIDDSVRQPNGLTVGLRLSGVQGATLGLANATLNIIDNDYDAGYVTFSSAAYVTNKTSGAAILTVNRMGANKGTLTVQCITTNGTAISGVNYTGVTNTLVWNSLDSTPRTVVVPLTQDGDPTGPTRMFSVYLTNAIVNQTNATDVLTGTPTTATVTIINDESYGKFQFSAPSYTVNENGGYISIPVVRTGGSAQGVTINFATSDGTAVSSGPIPNYLGVTNSLDFQAGEVAKTFNVMVLNDGLTNVPNFYFNVKLLGSTPGGLLGSLSNAPVNIVDAQAFNLPAGSPDTAFAPNPGFNGDVNSVAVQSDGKILAAGAFTVVNNFPRNSIARLTAGGDIDTAFLNSNSGLTGFNGPVQTMLLQTDQRILTAGPFTKMNGLNRNGLARVMSDGTLDSSFNSGAGGDNTIFALAETFLPDRRILVGGSFLNMNGASRPGLARLDNVGLLDSSFNPSLIVNGTVYAIAVYPTNTTQAGKIVIGGNFTAINGVPRNGIARLYSDGTLDSSFDPGLGATNPVRAVAIQLDGTILVGGSFTNFANAPLNHIARLKGNGQVDPSFNSGLGTDDTVDAIVLQPDTRIILAGLFSQANGVSRNRITRLLPDGSADPAANFGAGANAFVSSVALQADGMMVVGGGFTTFDGLARPHLARVYGGSLAGSGVFQFTQANFEADENSTNAVLTVRRRGGTAGNMTIDFGTVGLTAVPGVNFSNVQTTLFFPSGETLRTVKIPVMDDFQITPDLLVSNYLSNPSPPSGLGAQSFSYLTILNDDSAIQFARDSFSAFQNVAGGTYLVDLVRVGSSRGPAAVDFFTTTNGTAIEGLDYVAASNTVQFADGVTTAQVPVQILNNATALTDRTIGLQLTNTVNTLLGSPNIASLAILTTNETPGSLVFGQTNYVVSEADGAAYIGILRTNGHKGTVSVQLSTVGGSAIDGIRFIGTNTSVTFFDGETSKVIPIPVVQNNVFDGNQSLSVVLSNATGGATLLQPTNVPVTIIDDEVGLTFTSPFYVVPETAGTIALSVFRQNGTNGDTTVHYSTTNLSALSGTNYIGVTNASLTFHAGEVVKSIQLQVLHDPRVTGDLSLGISLFNPTLPAQIGAPGYATVVLQDNEAGISFATTNFIVETNDDLSLSTNAFYGVLKSAGTNLLITVARSNVNTAPVSAVCTTADGTGIQGVDYGTNWALLTFSNGVPYQTFPVQIVTNQFLRGNRSFSVYLTNPAPAGIAQLVTPHKATVTVTDDTSGLSFSSLVYNVNENASNAVITVNRDNWTNSAVSVDYYTSDGTGKANTNYIPVTGTLFFTNGETSKTFLVPVVDNLVVDGGHTVLLNLTNVVGNGAIGNPGSATLAIAETDGSLIIPAGVALLSETGPVNGVIDPGETVSLYFGLRNANGTNTASLVATLLATNGVSNPSVPQNYGMLAAHGPSASRPFTFTASGTNGQIIQATLALSDGGASLSNAVFTFVLGKTPAAYSNNTAIVINDLAAASPYPAAISVSNLNGVVIQATVTLSNLTHTYPKDIDALLVSPTGLKTFLMAHCGGQLGVNNVTLTFDDTTNNMMLAAGQITNGTYHPSSYALTPPQFPAAPLPYPTNSTASPYPTNLSVFNGSSPNGVWALYIYDDAFLNYGVIANGWRLNLTVSGPVVGAADVALGMTATPPTVVASSNITYTLSVTNFGPAGATNITVTDPLPPGTAFVSASPSVGSVTNSSGVILWNINSMVKDAKATLTLVLQANTSGTITNSAVVSSVSTDLNAEDDSAYAVTTVTDPSADLRLALSGNADPIYTGYNLVYSLTVSNQGPATAPALAIVDTLPPSVSFVSASPGGVYANNKVTFANLGNLGSGAKATVTITVKPNAAGTLTNTATASSSVTDPFKADNTASVKTVVNTFYMSVQQGPGTLTFGWPSDAPGAYLESTTNMQPPAIWTPVTTPPPSLIGGQKVITVPIGNGAKYFRLHGITQ
jgi:uncharacterized repeat protein (TIGR01451 family)/uncharacterized delta-60 repeat protein